MARPRTRPSDSTRPRLRGRLRALPWGRILLATAVAVVVIGVVPPFRRAAALAGSKVILFVASPLAPDVKGLDDLAATTKVLAADGSVLAELDGSQRREPLQLAQVPEHVRHAVLAAEDANFYDHSGIDPSAVFRALVRNVQGKRQGGSTITQQLAKLNYTSSERTFLRKLKEVLFASKLEKEYTKDELLERYLNQVYFGDGAYGLTAAAKVYFDTTPEKLTVEQAALLAGKIRSPSNLDPRAEPDAVKTRRDQVLRSMNQRGWLDDPELAAALAMPLSVVPEQVAAGKAPHFVEYVKREAGGIDELGGSPESRGKQLFTGGYTIHTTLDPKAFDAAVATVQQQLGRPEDPAAAVVSVQPGDGAIRVLIGGQDPNQRFDVASQGRRQPGSSFKPFVYLAMLRDGIDPRSQLESSSPMDLEYQGEKFTVDNYEGKSGGRIDVDKAMEQSVNTVFSQLTVAVGPPDVVRAAKDAGIDPDPPILARPAVGLGGTKPGVTPLEMAAAYATFAARGRFAEPYAIAKITDRSGNDVFVRKPEAKQVFRQEEVGVLNRALVRVVTSGTGTGANIGRPVAGKTGTTQNYTNAWFAGFTPQLATAVWVGRVEGDVPMTDVHGRQVTGGSFPAAIFAGTMKAALAGTKVEQIPTTDPAKLDLSPYKPPNTEDTGSTSSTSSTTSTTLTGETTTSTTLPPVTVIPGETTTTTRSNRPSTTTTSQATTTTTRPPSTTTTTTARTTTTVAPTSTTQKSQSTPTTSP